jgi:hypothetical protein
MHDNSIIALGFKRYGFAREAARIAREVSRAAGHFLLNQLPELYAGIQRDGRNFPVQYLGGNVTAGMGGRLDLHAGTDNARFPAGRTTEPTVR